jgi:hypothetical protein
MPINPDDLANDLKAAFSNSQDPVIKAAVDTYYNTLASIITNHIKRGSVVGVVVASQTQSNVVQVS